MPKGTIVLIPFPFTDLSGQKVRPALVLFNRKTGEDCIVAFISSKQDRKVREFDIPIKHSPHNGLKVDSTVKISKIATLQKRIVLGTLGTLESFSLKKVDKSLKNIFRI